MATEYKVIRLFIGGGGIDRDLALVEFTEIVNGYLSEGWQVTGGVSVCRDKSDYPHIYQAIYKNEIEGET